MLRTLCSRSKFFVASSPNTPEDQSETDPNDASPTQDKQPLTDDRARGTWQSRYPGKAQLQIAVEGIYLVVGLIACLTLLYQVAAVAHAVNGPKLHPNLFVGFSRGTLSLAAVAIGGACGGFAFALKWLYHGVAHGWWNQDRLVWRIVVPLLAGTLAMFTGLMISSGLIPIFSSRITAGPRIGAAFGFFVGFFSDNLLALLQKLANQTLGTLGRIEIKSERRPEP